MMSSHARNEYVREVSSRYKRASRPEKSQILDEFCQTGGYNRKYALGLLGNPPLPRKVPIERPRVKRYDAEIRRVLAQVWVMSNGLCSKRLVPFLPGPLPAHDPTRPQANLCPARAAGSGAIAGHAPGKRRAALPGVTRSRSPSYRGGTPGEDVTDRGSHVVGGDASPAPVVVDPGHAEDRRSAARTRVVFG